MLFSGFIVACGTTHVMAVWTLWHPTYWVSGILKALTMLISVCTAILLVTLVPKALALPSPDQLALANRDLAEQVQQRQQAEEALRQANEALESRVQARTVELTRSEAKLRQANESLEKGVVDRTAALTQANDRLQHELLERERTEAKLQEITTLQQAILDSANFTIISTETDGIITSFNARAEKLLGYAATEMIGQTTPAIIHDREEVAFHAQTLSQELGTLIEPGFEVFTAKTLRGYYEEREWSYIRKDGSRFPVLLSVTALHDPEGTLTGFLGIGSDITDHKVAQAALKESEERFRGAFDYAAIGMALVGLEGQWLKVNHSICEMIGYSAPELLQTDFQTITHPDDLETDLGYVHQLLKGEISFYQMEKRYFHKQGHIVWILLSASLTRDHQDRPLYFISQIQDISDRKRSEAERDKAEDDLRTLATQLEQSNQELQNFAFVASHDLKEPLRTIRNFSNLLQSRCGNQLSDQGKDYLERMQKAAQRMQTLIDDLLSLSRVTTQAQPFVLVDLNQIVTSVSSGLEMKIQETHAAIEAGTLPTLEADPTQMHQLLQNLISNALKFYGDKPPRIKIHSQMLPQPASKQPVSTKPMVQISIQDEGIGFDEQYSDRIFKIFERLQGRSEYEGTGIGLAVCRKIVERHYGSITAHSTPGHGATFLITLPLKQLIQSS